MINHPPPATAVSLDHPDCCEQAGGLQRAAMSERIDAAVVGAGVIGLAVGRALALRGLETIVLEARGRVGEETSSRNSEVIHAGIYYPPGSLKASTCVAGRPRLYRYLDERGVGHRRCGKLIVAASEEEIGGLRRLYETGVANGVEGLSFLTSEEARGLEPALACTAALHSAETGILDTHGYMRALQGDFEAAGGVVALGSRVLAGRRAGGGLTLQVVHREGETELEARNVVLAAGLQGEQLLRGLDGFPAAHVPRMRFAKGTYFALSGRSPFERLIYPLPDQAGLGVHLTMDLAGEARFGPDVEWVETPEYGVDPSRADSFYASIRRYWPDLPDGALQPAYSGVRPKLVGPGQPAADFLVQGPAAHGWPGLVNMLGIESPGITASLVLADLAADALAQTVSDR